VAAAFVISLLVVTACSSGGGKSGPRLTKDQFITRGNAICANTTTQIQNGAKTVFPNVNQIGEQDADKIVKFTRGIVVPALQKEHDDLGSLNSPSADSSFIDKMLSDLQNGINDWHNDPTLTGTINDKSFTSFNAEASDFGLMTCAQVDGVTRAIAGGNPYIKTP
jgi:hypothetical protein